MNESGTIMISERGGNTEPEEGSINTIAETGVDHSGRNEAADLCRWRQLQRRHVRMHS